jgi:hypothetical protein
MLLNKVQRTETQLCYLGAWPREAQGHQAFRFKPREARGFPLQSFARWRQIIAALAKSSVKLCASLCSLWHDIYSTELHRGSQSYTKPPPTNPL